MRRSTIVLLIIIVVMLILAIVTAEKSHAQPRTVIFSKWASDQVMHGVESEKPQIDYDTLAAGGDRYMYRTTFRYRDFRIEIIKDYASEQRIKVGCYSALMIVMLRPDDEYAILEKLIPLTQ